MEALTEQAVEYIVALIVGWISRHVYGKSPPVRGRGLKPDFPC